jgi:hypothetical protein
MTILGESDFIARFDAGETTIHARLFEKETSFLKGRCAIARDKMSARKRPYGRYRQSIECILIGEFPLIRCRVQRIPLQSCPVEV